MKLDFKCIRDIMLTLEKELQPDDNGIMTRISADYLCKLMSVKYKYPNGIIKAHLRFLFKSGALTPSEKYINEDMEGIEDITYPDGYSLIENLRSPDAIEVIYKVMLAGMPEKLSDFLKQIDRTRSDLLKP